MNEGQSETMLAVSAVFERNGSSVIDDFSSLPAGFFLPSSVKFNTGYVYVHTFSLMMLDSGAAESYMIKIKQRNFGMLNTLIRLFYRLLTIHRPLSYP